MDTYMNSYLAPPWNITLMSSRENLQLVTWTAKCPPFVELVNMSLDTLRDIPVIDTLPVP